MYRSGEKMSHIVVTPVKNEVDFLHQTIDSMAKQTILPSEWIIVDDFSTDGSRKILEDAEKEFEWIKLVKMNDESKRKRGMKIAKLINFGLERSDTEWSFFSKIDADIILPKNYFESIISEFENDDELGIGSGNCFVERFGKKKVEKVEFDHTRGALKTYRNECLSEIGGIREVDGWDGFDNMMAQFHGWKTKNFPHILVEHRRKTGSNEGVMRCIFWAGKKSHILRYSWLYLLAKGISQMVKWPYFIGGICLIMGFLWAKVTRVESMGDEEIALFIRKKQRNKLLRKINFIRPNDY